MGAKAPNWLGGKSFEPYSAEWNKQLKCRIRERDHRTCQLCSLPQDKHPHPVHHIDYNKENCLDSNLITLCRSCHGKVSKRREYWQHYFQALMLVGARTNLTAIEVQGKLTLD